MEGYRGGRGGGGRTDSSIFLFESGLIWSDSVDSSLS